MLNYHNNTIILILSKWPLIKIVSQKRNIYIDSISTPLNHPITVYDSHDTFDISRMMTTLLSCTCYISTSSPLLDFDPLLRMQKAKVFVLNFPLKCLRSSFTICGFRTMIYELCLWLINEYSLLNKPAPIWSLLFLGPYSLTLSSWSKGFICH